MLEEVEVWKKRHGAQFEKSKYVLIHFTRNHRQSTEAIIMNDITINLVNEAKYLGIIFDQNLKFKSHLDQVVKKGTKFGIAIVGIAKST